MDFDTFKLEHDFVNTVANHMSIAGVLRDGTLRLGKKYVCPFPHHNHSKNTPSFVVYRDGFRCFGNCGASGGDVIDFLGIWQYGYSYDPKRHAHIIAGGREITRPPQYTVIDAVDEDSDFSQLRHEHIDRWHANLELVPDVRNYLIDRGVSDEYMRWREIGWTGKDESIHHDYHDCITIPWHDHHNDIVGIKVKKPGKRGYFAIRGSSFEGIYGYRWTNCREGIPHVFIVETELDSLFVNGAVGESCCVAKPANGFMPHHAALFDMVQRIIILPDNDTNSAGIRGFQRIKKVLPRAEVQFVPDAFKDVGEYWEAEPGECLDWLRGLVGATCWVQPTTGDELSDFALFEFGSVVYVESE